MRHWTGILIIFIGLYGCNSIHGDGKIKEESRQVPDFTSIKNSGSIDVEFNPGTAIGVKVITDENILPYVVTEVVNGQLLIHYKENTMITGSDTKVVVSAPSVNSLTGSGSGDITSNCSIENNQLIELRSSGSGDIKVQLNAPGVKIIGTGSGDFNIDGFTKDMTATMTGSGNLDCKGLKAETVNVKLTGSSEASVFASKTLDALITGSGDILYFGNPSLNSVKVTGSGKVKSGELPAQSVAAPSDSD